MSLSVVGMPATQFARSHFRPSITAGGAVMDLSSALGATLASQLAGEFPLVRARSYVDAQPSSRRLKMNHYPRT
jgi:hypothetical protein